MEFGFVATRWVSSWVKMCWDSIEQRGTWHETDGGYLGKLVVWTMYPVASEMMLLTETFTLQT